MYIIKFDTPREREKKVKAGGLAHKRSLKGALQNTSQYVQTAAKSMTHDKVQLRQSRKTTEDMQVLQQAW